MGTLIDKEVEDDNDVVLYQRSINKNEEEFEQFDWSGDFKDDVNLKDLLYKLDRGIDR
jgi:hypothetical protein